MPQLSILPAFGGWHIFSSFEPPCLERLRETPAGRQDRKPAHAAAGGADRRGWVRSTKSETDPRPAKAVLAKSIRSLFLAKIVPEILIPPA